MADWQAIVAAAGRGTRFLPCTKIVPKELLPLYDRPVIQHLLEEIDAAGIERVTIVARPGTAEALRDYFQRDPDWDDFLAEHDKSHLLQPLYDLLDRLTISYAVQPPDGPYGTGAPLLAVQGQLAGPFVYLYGDDVIAEEPRGDTLRALLRLFETEGADAVVGACRVPRDEIAHLGSIAYRPGAGDRVEGIVEKPEPDEAPSDVTPIGRMVLSPAIVPILEAQAESLAAGQELWMTDALSTLARAGRVLAPLIPGRWLTTGDPRHWLEAAAAMAEPAVNSVKS